MQQKPLLQRAFELARTGKFPRTRQIKDVLKKKEGYVRHEIEAHFAGRVLRKQIKSVIQPQ